MFTKQYIHANQIYIILLSLLVAKVRSQMLKLENVHVAVSILVGQTHTSYTMLEMFKDHGKDVRLRTYGKIAIIYTSHLSRFISSIKYQVKVH